MCRLLGYLGRPVQLDHLLYKPEHSLVVQSYQPREMTAGLLNADGFGVGWYHSQRVELPYTYRNTLPIWNDTNLPSLSRYVESHCVVASVRSATPGLAVNLSNCPPFQHGQVLAVHNGFIERFRQTLYRAIGDRLHDELYQAIQGTTDSEHIMALLLQIWTDHPTWSLAEALIETLHVLTKLAAPSEIVVGANLILSDGDRLVASRFSNRSPAPSLYWLRESLLFPDAVIIASEPLFSGDWVAVPEQTIVTVAADLSVQTLPI